MTGPQRQKRGVSGGAGFGRAGVPPSGAGPGAQRWGGEQLGSPCILGCFSTSLRCGVLVLLTDVQQVMAIKGQTHVF